MNDTEDGSCFNVIIRLDNDTKTKSLEGKTELKKDPSFSKSYINNALTRDQQAKRNKVLESIPNLINKPKDEQRRKYDNQHNEPNKKGNYS